LQLAINETLFLVLIKKNLNVEIIGYEDEKITMNFNLFYSLNDDET